MKAVEKKWRANQEKVAFAKGFPGRIREPGQMTGRTVKTVVPISGRSLSVVVFENGEYLFLPTTEVLPADLLAALEETRGELEPFHQTAYRTLDALTQEDRQCQREARLENILGAIRNNLPQIPELKEAVRRLLDELDSGEKRD